MTRAPLLATSAFAALIFAFAAPAAAQTATTSVPAGQPSSTDASTFSDIVVTARGRSEKLIDVPISIQTFSAEKLVQDNITNLNALQSQAGFTFNSQGSTFFGGGREFPTLVFRGLTSNYGGGFADSGAVFLDGIFISGGAASITFADVSQVEVLKGPQNVYFGKNTFGGAINLITSHPSENFHGSASGGYSTKGSYEDTASVEGALIPGLLTGRITGELMHQGKQYTSADGGPLGKQDTKGVTGVLYLTPSPDLWLQGRVHYSHDNDSGAADGFIGGAAYGATCPGMTNPYFCGTIPNGIASSAIASGTTIQAPLLSAVAANNFYGAKGALIDQVPRENKDGLIRDNIQASLQGGANLPYGAKFLFNLGFNQAKSLDISSSDHTPNNVFTTAQPIVSRDFEGDARIFTDVSKPLRLVVGFNYFHSIYRLAYDGYFFALFANSNPVNETDTTYAGYGSIEYDIMSTLTLTGEGRFQHDTVTDGDLDGLTPLLATPVSKSYNHFLPRVSLKYHPTAQSNIYVSYSEGIQQPELQTSLLTADAFEKTALASQGVSTSPYTQDPKLKVFEVGAKQSLLNEKLFFSIAYYNQKWENALVNNYYFNDPANGCSTVPTMGVSAACPYPGSGAAAYSTSNNHIQGIEFEATGRITPHWSVHTTINYTDAKRTDYYDNNWGASFTNGQVPTQNGKRVDLVPAVQGSLDTTYRDRLIGDFNWYVHALATYTGKQYVDPANIASIKGFARVNLSAGITKGNLSFEGYVTNLFQDKNYDYAVRFPDPAFFFSEAHQGVIAGLPNPRNFGFKISMKF